MLLLSLELGKRYSLADTGSVPVGKASRTAGGTREWYPNPVDSQLPNLASNQPYHEPEDLEGRQSVM